MANEDELVKLLESIDRRLALLTVPQERDLRQTLRDDLLNTPVRVAMFEAVDGVRGSKELAKIGGVGDRSAQVFVKELQDLRLLRPVPGGSGNSVIVERDEGAIVDWYLQRKAAQ